MSTPAPIVSAAAAKSRGRRKARYASTGMRCGFGMSTVSRPIATPPRGSCQRATARSARTVIVLTLPMTRSWTIGGKASTRSTTTDALAAGPSARIPEGGECKHGELDDEPDPGGGVRRQRDQRREEERADRRVAEGIGVRPVVQRRRVVQRPIRRLLVAAREVEGEVALRADPDDDRVREQDADRGEEDQRAGI